MQEPAKGQYWFPGGRVLKGELIPAAAGRKALEETGLSSRFQETVSIEETIFPRRGEMACDIHTLNVCCRLAVDALDGFALDGTHEGHLWVDAEQARALDLHPGVIGPILKCLA